MNSFFQDLGRRIDADWRGQQYASEALAGIASEHLANTPPHESVEWRALVEDVLEADSLPPQTMDPNGSFGEPPISVYENDLLVIQVLFWLDGTTSIHDHAFVGAFSLMSGQSVHTRYRFEERRSLGPRVKVGSLARASTELLRPGDVRAIDPLSGTTHALFHVDLPSVTVVVRSTGLAVREPQWSYLPPGLAFDPFFEPVGLRKRLAMLRAAVRIDEVWGRALLERFVSTTDVHAGIFATLAAFDAAKDRRLASDAVGLLLARHGDELSIMRDVLEDRLRSDNLVTRRRMVDDSEHRFFLALLLTVPDRETLLEIVGSRFPQTDAIERVCGWVAALGEADGSSDTKLGVALGDDELWTLERLLQGKSERAILEESASSGGPRPGAVEKACFVLPELRALRPLFRSGDAQGNAR